MFIYRLYNNTSYGEPDSSAKFYAGLHKMNLFTGPHTAICGEYDCRSRGREFNPRPACTLVEIDHEIFSTFILLLLLIQDRLVSVTSKSIKFCTKYWLTA